MKVAATNIRLIAQWIKKQQRLARKAQQPARRARRRRPIKGWVTPQRRINAPPAVDLSQAA